MDLHGLVHISVAAIPHTSTAVPYPTSSRAFLSGVRLLYNKERQETRVLVGSPGNGCDQMTYCTDIHNQFRHGKTVIYSARNARSMSLHGIHIGGTVLVPYGTCGAWH